MLGECRVQLRIHAQYPAFFIGEYAAFYRIFFCHEYGIGISIGYIAERVAMMVGKGMGLCRQSKFIQMREEALRVADSRDGVQAQAVKI